MPRTQYRQLRESLTPQLRSLPDHSIRQIVASHGLEAGAIEDFWDDLGNVVASALPVVGGAVGSIIAPGIGTSIGAGLGSVAGGALHSAIGPGRPAGAQPAPAFPAGAAGIPYPYLAPATAASSQQSAAQLMQLIMRPEFMRALVQMLLGTAGNPTVSVPSAPMAPPAAAAAGASQVPISAFTNLLSTLATQASESYNAEHATEPSSPQSHYGGRSWGSGIDAASEEERAGRLMNLLRESDYPQALLRQHRRQRKQRLATLAQALRMADSRNGAIDRT